MSRRPITGRAGRRAASGLVALTLVLGEAAMLAPPASAAGARRAAPPRSTAPATIGSRGPAAISTYSPDSTVTLSVPVPTGSQPGDVVIAVVGFGTARSTTPVSLAAPAGWTAIQRTDAGATASVALFSHTVAAGETTYSWSTALPVGGVVQAVTYAGVDPTRPVDTTAGRSYSLSFRSVAAPALTTTGANEALLATFFGYQTFGFSVSWGVPAGFTLLGSASDPARIRSSSTDTALRPAPGPVPGPTASVSVLNAAIATLTALRPAPAAPAPPVITGVTATSVGATGTTVSWTTDQPADSQIDFGPTPAYGSTTALDPTLVTAHSQAITGLAAGLTYHYRVKSKNAAGQLALGPDATLQTKLAPVPLIIDTDIFSDAADAGTLAAGFGLQIKGEANVIAIGVNTRQSRPAVATNSWKCAAAVAQFYKSGNVPIGTDMPNNGTELNTVDFVGPCGLLASPTTPVPDTAVNVFRRALSGQADGSVVIVCTGYEENLAALLASPADAISPLSGHDLVAQKVKTLVIMGGGYPSRSGENNLEGNPASAQAVSANWPGKIVWSGYEVGDLVHTGQTISSVHPANSPVRVAYEAFVGPNNWVYSYDLTALYHAIRPNDGAMTEVGPGTNAISDTGGNTFTLGAGNQYYLQLNDATTLDASIEALLDALPPLPPPPTVQPNDTFSTNTIDPSKWTVSTTGSTVSAANQELEISHTGTAWTKGVLQSAGAYDQTGHSVQVQLKRAANNGLGGPTFGETSIYLSADSTHYAYFFVASGTLTAWVNSGSGEINLTPAWPAYSATTMQWLRFRESAGVLYFEYASGASAPQTWTTFASLADPFAVGSVSLKLAAGSNVASTDTAAFDNISTY